MKKTLIAAALFAFSSVAYSATVNWSVAGVYQPGTTTAGAGYAVYLFEASDSLTFASIASAVEGGTFSSIASSALASGTTLASGAFMKTGLGNYSGTTEVPTTVDFIALVLDAGAYADAENFAMASTSLSFTSATGSKTAVFTNFSTNNQWQAVPEPTSGLLMLLGMAGLALRRRRS